MPVRHRAALPLSTLTELQLFSPDVNLNLVPVLHIKILSLRVCFILLFILVQSPNNLEKRQRPTGLGHY